MLLQWRPCAAHQGLRRLSHVLACLMSLLVSCPFVPPSFLLVPLLLLSLLALSVLPLSLIVLALLVPPVLLYTYIPLTIYL